MKNRFFRGENSSNTNAFRRIGKGRNARYNADCAWLEDYMNVTAGVRGVAKGGRLCGQYAGGGTLDLLLFDGRYRGISLLLDAEKA